ncbi:hypothetical protein [Chitinophaga caseinilytica]|uniref:hypothetical protein n=1 Tax=Chitinophaga caseinilytica TaxID=2267521 RepID=UPI003C2C70CA
MHRILFCLLAISAPAWASGPDEPFAQAVSSKYPLPKGIHPLKLVTDYNNNVHVLAKEGLYYFTENDVVRDVRFRPLADKIPVDVTAQETHGHLYYLLGDKLITNGYAGVPYVTFPAGTYDRAVVNAAGNALLSGKGKLAVAEGKNIQMLDAPEEGVRELFVNDGIFYALTPKALYRVAGKELQRLHAGKDMRTVAFRGNDILLGTPAGYYAIRRENGDTAMTLQRKVPVPAVGRLMVADGKIWAGTNEGAYTENGSGGYRYFASGRWLDQDEVKDMATDKDGNIWILTPSGLNRIAFRRQSLAEKTDYFQRKIRTRHIRYGFIANIHLLTPGDVRTAEMADTDNDGLWSSFYLGSQAFRYATTREPEAKRFAWEAFEAFERILSINQLKGFPSRTFERKGYKNSDPERWRDSPDPEWEWKGHTSSDEFVAYIWIAAVLNEMVAETTDEKRRVADFMDKIMTHIIDNKWYLVDIDNKPTLWGRWNPEYINWYPETIGDRRLGSTTIIAGLQLAYALTGKEKYKTEGMKLLNKHHYLQNIQIDYRKIAPTKGYFHDGIDMGTGPWNHSDDEMAFLTYWVLYRYAYNDDLKRQYAGAIRNHWEVERPEKNAVWNLITKGLIGDFDEEATIWWLRTFPMDMISWKIKNSHRQDLTFIPENFRGQTTETLIPLDEQPLHRHNANAFNLDGGNGGRTELAGDEYLLPYWMARYLKVIE